MAKDPATLWYWGDWAGGTSTFTRHLKGCYMDLLNAQFNNGHLSLDEIKTVLGSDFGSSWPTLQKKFKVDNVGLFFNERAEIEKNKRIAFTESRKRNLTPHKETQVQPHMVSHMENENRNTIKYSNGDVTELSKYLSTIYKKKYDRHEGGQIGQDIDYMSKALLKSMDVKTIKEQARNHKLYTHSQGLTLPTRLEKIQAALLDTDWISKLNDSQNKDALQNGLNNEQARRGTRISNGSDLPPANLGNLDN